MVINLKLADGAPTTGGPQVCLGTEETYIPCCSKDYHARIPREVTTLLGFDKLGLGEKPVDPARDLQALSGLLSTPKQKELAEQEGGADPAVLTTTPSPVNDRIKSLGARVCTCALLVIVLLVPSSLRLCAVCVDFCVRCVCENPSLALMHHDQITVLQLSTRGRVPVCASTTDCIFPSSSLLDFFLDRSRACMGLIASRLSRFCFSGSV